MREPNVFFVAIRKSDGKQIFGYRGQAGMSIKASLGKSIGQCGIKRSEYDYYKVNLDTMTKELVK